MASSDVSLLRKACGSRSFSRIIVTAFPAVSLENSSREKDERQATRSPLVSSVSDGQTFLGQPARTTQHWTHSQSETTDGGVA